MQIQYQVFKKEKLVYQKFTGAFSVDIYRSYAQAVIMKSRSRRIHFVIIDFRDTLFDANMPEFDTNIRKMVDIHREMIKKRLKYKDVKHIFWVDKPMPTVVAELFIAHFPGYKYHYCSTAQEILLHTNLFDCSFNLTQVSRHLKHVFEEQLSII